MKFIDITTSDLAGMHTKVFLCHLKASRYSVGDTFELNKVAKEIRMDYTVAIDACRVLRNRGIISSVDVETFTLLKPLTEDQQIGTVSPVAPASKPAKQKGPLPPDAET